MHIAANSICVNIKVGETSFSLCISIYLFIYLFILLFNTFEQYRDNTDNRDNFGHDNRDMKF